MSTINQQLIAHLAALAKLELSVSEQAIFSEQLNKILNYFNQLQELDTQSIAATSQVIDLVNVARLDEVKKDNADIQKNIFNNAPQTSGRYFKVNKIL